MAFARMSRVSSGRLGYENAQRPSHVIFESIYISRSDSAPYNTCPATANASLISPVPILFTQRVSGLPVKAIPLRTCRSRARRPSRSLIFFVEMLLQRERARSQRRHTRPSMGSARALNHDAHHQFPPLARPSRPHSRQSPSEGPSCHLPFE